MNELALFAGAGGGILGGAQLGWKTICAVETDPYCAGVLMQRQNDGLLPPFPVWDDVRTFDGRPWNGIVDVVSGGFPCQDISAAGQGKGISGERSGLWFEMLRIAQEVMPRYVFIENSPMLRTRGLEVVLQGLADAGFNARWGIVSAADVGAPHFRKRIWIVANTNSGRSHRNEDNEICTRRNAAEPCVDYMAHSKIDGREQGWTGKVEKEGGRRQFKDVRSDTNGKRLEIGQGQPGDNGSECSSIVGTDWWQSEPNVGRVAHGVAARVDRLKSLGNGQVPAAAALAWRLLSDEPSP